MGGIEKSMSLQTEINMLKLKFEHVIICKISYQVPLTCHTLFLVMLTIGAYHAGLDIR